MRRCLKSDTHSGSLSHSLSLSLSLNTCTQTKVEPSVATVLNIKYACFRSVCMPERRLFRARPSSSHRSFPPPPASGRPALSLGSFQKLPPATAAADVPDRWIGHLTHARRVSECISGAAISSRPLKQRVPTRRPRGRLALTSTRESAP